LIAEPFYPPYIRPNLEAGRIVPSAEDIIINLSIGVGSGIVASGITLVLAWNFRRIIRPYLEQLAYHGANVAGEWKRDLDSDNRANALKADHRALVTRMAERKHQLSLLTPRENSVTETYDDDEIDDNVREEELRREIAERGDWAQRHHFVISQKAHHLSGHVLLIPKDDAEDRYEMRQMTLKGEIADRFVFGTIRPTDKTRLGLMVFLGEVGGDGGTIRGSWCYYSIANGTISSDEVVWVRVRG
jgi:hypothetical protein